MITPDNHDVQRGKSWFDETGSALKFLTGAIIGLVFALISLLSLLSGDNSFCMLFGFHAVITIILTILAIG